MESRGEAGGPGWLTTLLGVVVLVAAGFAFGLIAGVVSQEPELVLGHVQGRGESVSWAVEPVGQGGAEPAADSVAADTEPLPPVGSEGPAGAKEPSPRVPPRESASQPASSAAPAAVATTSLPVAPAGRYSVQVGAFSDSAGADRVAASLGEKGYPVYVAPATGDGRWRVRVGPVKGRRQAEQVAQKLKQEEQLPTWVLAEGGGS